LENSKNPIPERAFAELVRVAEKKGAGGRSEGEGEGEGKFVTNERAVEEVITNLSA